MVMNRVEPSSVPELSLIFGNSTEKKTKNERPPKGSYFPKRGNFFLKNDAFHSLRDDDPNIFANAIGPILLAAQFFGLLPISGIRSGSLNKFEFRKTLRRTVLTYTVIVASFLLAIVYFFYTLKFFTTISFFVSGGIADAILGIVFYGDTFLGTTLFLNLSPRWITLQHDWRAMEQSIDRFQKERPKLKWKFVLMTATVLLLTLVENIVTIFVFTTPDVLTNFSFDHFLKIYTENYHPFLAQHVQYNFSLGLFIFIISKIATFTWNFTDLFIMLVSTGLAERYKQLNQHFANHLTGQFSPAEWKQFREFYAILSTLVKKVDNEISPMILLSFVNNLFFICLQLFNGISFPDDARTISRIYYFGSFAFLIGRSVAVILFAARVNDQSKVALPVLYNCPRTAYTSEAQRLQYQLTTDEVTLTGLRFFSITRNLILAVAGGIVTYGIVLLQFNLDLKKK